MKPHGGIISGPSLYRHECRTCAEETLHNARGCCRCGTSPWTTRIRLTGSARTVLEYGMKRHSARK